MENKADIDLDKPNDSKIKMGVSVSKKYFKKAVDRNYFKRVLRECYRLNKHILTENLEKTYTFMFFYQSKDRLTFHEIQEKTNQLFEKFVENVKYKLILVYFLHNYKYFRSSFYIILYP